jgi:hypothetical protein
MKRIAALSLVFVAVGCTAAVDGEAPNGEVQQAFSGPTPTATLYRGFHYAGADGDHFLTTDPNEISRAGYASDGPIAQCWPTTDGARLPFYRMYNPTTHDHLYTLNFNETQSAARTGMVSEGTTCYLYLTQAFPDLRPLYRLYSREHSEHLFTVKASERDSLTLNGWTYEGIAGWLY